MIRILVAAAMLAISACATVRTSLPMVSAERYLAGRITVHYKDLATDREENLHGRFSWSKSGSQNGSRTEISLLDPLGQSLALIQTDTHDAVTGSTLTLKDGKIYRGATAEDLSEQVLGWRLPARGLSDWLDGKPAFGSSVQRSSDASGFVQDGWTVSYPARMADQLPRRIDLNYPGPPVLVEIRLVIDERNPSP